MQQERVSEKGKKAYFYFFVSHCLTACPELAACLKNARKKLIVNEKSVFEGVQLLTNSAQARNGWNVFALAKENNSKDNGNNNGVCVSRWFFSLPQACLSGKWHTRVFVFFTTLVRLKLALV